MKGLKRNENANGVVNALSSQNGRQNLTGCIRRSYKCEDICTKHEKVEPLSLVVTILKYKKFKKHSSSENH